MAATNTNTTYFTLTPKVIQFIERFGQHYEKTYGIPRIAGRIWGLLLLAPRHLSNEEIGATLGVSHGSISTNLRLLVILGVVEKITLPGDRCDYYQFSPTAWDEVLKKRLISIESLRELASQAMEEIQPEGLARHRLEDMFTWIEMAHEKYEELMNDWNEYKSQSRA